MAQTNPTLPSIGAQRGDNEVVVRSDLVAILAELNGNLDSSNIRDGSIAGTDLAANAVGADRLATLPQVRLFVNAAQGVPNGGGVIGFDTESYDTGTPLGNMHDPVTSNWRVTCRVTGLYHLAGSVAFTANAAGSRAAYFVVNGTTRIAQTQVPPAAGDTLVPVATDWRLSLNDYVELWAYQDSGSTVNLAAGTAYGTTFSAHFVSP